MAKGWRKDDYNRQLFGQKVSEYRSTLHWSLGHLAQLSGINKGTLQHVEKGEAHLSNAKRQTLIDVLAQGLQHIGQSTNRQEFLAVAGLTTASPLANTASSPAQFQSVEIPEASGQRKLLHDLPHEEYAELLNQQQEWQLAATFWLLAAQEAKHAADWTKWSRCLLRAGLMELTMSQFELAERRFKEIIDKSEDEVGTLAVAEAYMRLGWVYYEQDKFSEARQALLKSRVLLQNHESKNPQSLHLARHGSSLVQAGDELIMALESTRLHWLGRTYVDWGIERDDQTLIKEGIAKLRKCEHYEGELGLYPSVGMALLRQVPSFLHRGELDTSENYLARGEELLGTQGTNRGHIYLHKGLLTLEERPKKAKDYLESAREGFIKPLFYPRGISEVFKEISGLYLMDDKKIGDEMALHYAFATVILHPYGRNLALLQLAARQMYWRTGENVTAFKKYWRSLEEKLWRMDSEPFSVLRHLMMSFHESGIQHIEMALEQARKAVNDELFRK